MPQTAADEILLPVVSCARYLLAVHARHGLPRAPSPLVRLVTHIFVPQAARVLHLRQGCAAFFKSTKIYPTKIFASSPHRLPQAVTALYPCPYSPYPLRVLADAL